jgi:putative transposase
MSTRPSGESAHKIRTRVGFSKRVSGPSRDELLNQHRWRSIAKARDAIDPYWKDFNEVPPHGALDDRTPGEVARRYGASLDSQDLE